MKYVWTDEEKYQPEVVEGNYLLYGVFEGNE